jgi:hypothetical protein
MAAAVRSERVGVLSGQHVEHSSLTLPETATSPILFRYISFMAASVQKNITKQ